MVDRRIAKTAGILTLLAASLITPKFIEIFPFLHSLGGYKAYLLGLALCLIILSSIYVFLFPKKIGETAIFMRIFKLFLVVVILFF